MHGLYTYLEEHAVSGEAALHEMSHGESFLEVLRTRFDSPGFYCLDEPEAALSFSSTLGLIDDPAPRGPGRRRRCSARPTRRCSPPCPARRSSRSASGATAQARWEDLELVQHWRAYLEAPQRYLRHVLDD